MRWIWSGGGGGGVDGSLVGWRVRATKGQRRAALKRKKLILILTLLLGGWMGWGVWGNEEYEMLLQIWCCLYAAFDANWGKSKSNLSACIAYSRCNFNLDLAQHSLKLQHYSCFSSTSFIASKDWVYALTICHFWESESSLHQQIR